MEFINNLHSLLPPTVTTTLTTLLAQTKAFTYTLSTPLVPLYLSLSQDRLVTWTPPRIETAGVLSNISPDVCYVNPTVYCKHLEPGHREVVANWFISPEQLANETVIVCGIYGILLLIACSYMSTPINVTRKNAVSLEPPLFLKLPFLITLCVQTYYKLIGYESKIYFMSMPCNMLIILFNLISFAPVSNGFRHAVIQCWFSFQILVWAVFANADTDDLQMRFEVEFFWANHVLLLLPPFYYVFTGKVSTLPEWPSNSKLNFFINWVTISCCQMGLLYFGVVTPLGVFSKLNLNYMLSPVPGTGMDGTDYRILCQGALVCAFGLARFVITIVEVLLKKVGGGKEKEKRY